MKKLLCGNCWIYAVTRRQDDRRAFYSCAKCGATSTVPLRHTVRRIAPGNRESEPRLEALMLGRHKVTDAGRKSFDVEQVQVGEAL